jgi:hypothetical protein
MAWRGAVLIVCLGLGVARPGHAADPAISTAETSVRLGLTAGYGSYDGTTQPQQTATGGVIGADFGVGALTPMVFGGIGFPDLYTDAGYDFTAGFLHHRANATSAAEMPYASSGNDYNNSMIVRLGLGRPVAADEEMIPFVAGGYQNWHHDIVGLSGAGALYQAGLIGAGLKFDVAASSMLVVTASAEGLAVIGGSVSAPSENFSGNLGTSAEERVSLDADYRIDQSWHAFAGLGFTHYDFSGSKSDVIGGYEPLGSALQVNSVFGIAYGF